VNDGCSKPENKLGKVEEWLGHIKKLNADTILFNPLFESDVHGYDTRDYLTVDRRLGTNKDLKKLCKKLHAEGMKVVFDGVFNHVGRNFWAFKDVQEKKWDSLYKNWFYINFDGESAWNDGFWYEGWEGCFDLVKLNHQNPKVRNYLINEVAQKWVEEFDIDGIRLDVAYSLDLCFLSELRNFANKVKPKFWLLGETLHGDYNIWMNDNACHSVTNYDCYAGMHSSLNSSNMHEISYSLNRQFGADECCVYTGKHLLSFVDNHDVTRVASILNDKNQIPLIFGLCFGMPGIPSIYYGSEWGAEGQKSNGDPALRPCFEEPEFNKLSEFVSNIASAHAGSKALCYGTYKNILVEPLVLIFERLWEDERVLVAINASADEYIAHFDAGAGRAKDLITGSTHDFGGGSVLPPYSIYYWKIY
ncbi:MAG: maltodextrin glucosidase, partial [Eggerthellaceae bacterium]|nr:maltodextrin glucosidase [Eggerthellaceae bacterium]